MSRVATAYSLSHAARVVGASRHLVAFLVRDRQIPTLRVGRSKAIDADGLARLRAEVAAFRAKPEPEAASRIVPR